jgi:hypothetical protein
MTSLQQIAATPSEQAPRIRVAQIFTGCILCEVVEKKLFPQTIRYKALFRLPKREFFVAQEIVKDTQAGQ